MGIRDALKKIGLKTGHILEGQWVVRRTIWPYPEGWGTYHTGSKMILETGLHSKAYAQALCDSYNSGNLHPIIDPNDYPTDLDKHGIPLSRKDTK